MNNFEAEPQLKPRETLTAVNQQMTVAGVPMELFELPFDPEKATEFDMIATDNPNGFQDLLEGGVSSLRDGESIHLSTIRSKDAGNPEWTESIKVYNFTRTGGYFVMGVSDEQGVYPRTPVETEATDLHIEDATKRMVGLVAQDVILRIDNRDIGLVRKGGRIAEVTKAMGFTAPERDSMIPLPDTLRSNISALQEAGLRIPNIKFFKEGVIDGQDYLETWAGVDNNGEGEFPVSEQPGYLAHDLFTEHWRALVKARERAMVPANLYAKTVLESDEVVAQVYATKHEGNKIHPDLVEKSLRGQDKIDHAAICLDRFTTEISGITGSLDLEEHDPRMPENAFTEFPSNAMTYTPQMIKTILASSHKDELVSFFDEVGSKAYDKQTGIFDYETYARELFRDAQLFWSTEVQPSPELEK